MAKVNVPPMKTLAECGDVLTAEDLCAVLRMTPKALAAANRRQKATKRMELPPRLPSRSATYARVDVATWIANGGAASRHLRRA